MAASAGADPDRKIAWAAAVSARLRANAGRAVATTAEMDCRPAELPPSTPAHARTIGALLRAQQRRAAALSPLIAPTAGIIWRISARNRASRRRA